MNAKLLLPLAILLVAVKCARPDEPGKTATANESKADGSKSDERATAKPADASLDQIHRWIEQLDSDEYWTREDASKRLFRAGRAAIGPLSEAARSEKLEVSARAVGVLGRFVELDDPQVELAAETVLEEIAASRVSSAAARAESALDGYRGSRQERALSKLRQLGATVASTALSTGAITRVEITIGEGWRGTPDDLAALKRVPALQRLSIYVGGVNDDAIKYLTPLRQLTSLELFGTGITDDGEGRLKEALPGLTTLDRRKGGLLGVRGSPDARAGGCLVESVQPGSAAEKAGLQPGDIITKFEGQRVEDFPSLTKMIATKAGGDTVEFELEREAQNGDKVEKQSLNKKVTLDQWKSRPTLNVNDSDLEIIIRR